MRVKIFSSNRSSQIEKEMNEWLWLQENDDNFFVLNILFNSDPDGFAALITYDKSIRTEIGNDIWAGED